MRLLITGGAGFIGSAAIRRYIMTTDHHILNLDKLTYAGNLESLTSVVDSDRYLFIEADICDQQAVLTAFEKFKPDSVLHFAAESHVDRSIDNPIEFINTNIVGTSVLLEVARSYLKNLPVGKKEAFRFLHVSTDEVYGSLGNQGFFTEQTAYDPSSPYSASKAASDHLVRAWYRTYKLPILMTNCSNNYGPYQFPEKLIPLMILNALEGKDLPVYGDGQQVRDWLFVDDHLRALDCVLQHGKVGEVYNIGGHNEKTNLDVVQTICDLLDELRPEKPKGITSYRDLIAFVPDRPGHDQRYAIDASKIQRDLGWLPSETFVTGIRRTVDWYIENETWCLRVQDGSYLRERLGVYE